MNLYSEGLFDPVLIVVHPSNSATQEDLDRLQEDFKNAMGGQGKAIVINPYLNDKSGIRVEFQTDPPEEDA